MLNESDEDIMHYRLISERNASFTIQVSPEDEITHTELFNESLMHVGEVFRKLEMPIIEDRLQKMIPEVLSDKTVKKMEDAESIIEDCKEMIELREEMTDSQWDAILSKIDKLLGEPICECGNKNCLKGSQLHSETELHERKPDQLEGSAW